ncbi:MAG: SusD/RagB family nutrient-binding outer membrane lipoprotein [Proteiniphilum sp.]|jgi:hypothetical protein|nr:SusD/RagB family nutrient-binding outer membrane lipoprotein [Proteiniphilum sp.]
MKKIKYLTIVLTIIAASLYTTSCKDDFAEVNTNPTSVTSGNPSYLFAQAILEFEPQGYLYWFYNASEIFQWVQTAVSTGSVTSTLANGAPAQSFKSIDVLKYANELKYVRSEMPEEESAKYAKYAAAIDVLCVYMGIFDTDFTGDISYTEAAQAAHGGTLTPKYDRVEDLYSLWLKNLDDDMKTLTAKTGQIYPAQDPVYAGDTEKWAKLANSLKLKIAARLIIQNRNRALEIAKEVVDSPVGVISEEADDFLFNKAISAIGDNDSNNQDYVYHWENDILQTVGGSETMIDFLVKNRDPRVRFIFKKNQWSSEVVQLFLDDEKKAKDIPHFIRENMVTETDGDGVDRFKEWKEPGEPWVRYYGLPLDFDAAHKAAEFGDWFNYTVRSQYDSNHTYRPYSTFQTEMLQGRIDFTYPSVPEETPAQDAEDVPWWGMYMTSAEVNLYLAEFKLLGATLSETADAYFNKALKASVKSYDKLAAKNKIPYYGTTYGHDSNEKPIDLVDGEIETMMANKDYQLTDDKTLNLEKVYLQQIIHFSLQPIDQYTTARRSGIPIAGSSLFPRKIYTEVPVTKIPRRMALNQPSPTDLMHDILINSYKAQGLSVGSGDILNTERLWQDKGAPQWGQGPLGN